MQRVRDFLRHNWFDICLYAVVGLIIFRDNHVGAVVYFAVTLAILITIHVVKHHDDRDHDRDEHRSFARVTHDDDRVDDGDCDGDDYLSGDEWSAFLDTIDPRSGDHWERDDCARCHHPRCTGRPTYYVSHADDHHHYCTHHRPRVHRH